MQNGAKIVAGILVLMLLTLLGGGVYVAVRYIVDLFADLDPQVATITGTASVVVLLGALILAATVRGAQKRDEQHRLRQEKAAVYRELIESWSAALHGLERSLAHRIQSPSDQLQVAERQLLLWGSRNVIQRYNAYRKRSIADPDDPELPALMDEVLLQIRRDLGHSTLGTKPGELLALFQHNTNERTAPQVGWNATVHAGNRMR